MSSEAARRVEARYRRAQKLLGEFDAAKKAFFDSGPIVVAARPNFSTGQREHFVHKIKPVPDELNSIAVDLISNLRKPLDQVLNLIATKRSGKEGEVTYFPIANDRPFYEKRRKKLPAYLNDITHDIDSLEPYKSGRGHALWQLNKLSNFDKHADLIEAEHICTGIEITAGMFQSFAPDIKLDKIFIREDPPEHLKLGTVLYMEPLAEEFHPREFQLDIAYHMAKVIETREPTALFSDLFERSYEAFSLLRTYL